MQKPDPDAPLFIGPLRRAPAFYAGETFGRRPVQYPDTERYGNGALASRRDKLARRVIRAGLKRTYSSLTKSLRLAQGLKAQAYEAARDEQPKGAKRGRWARRLLEKELSIHQPVYVPADLRALRTERRKKARKGLPVDAISALVDAQAKKKP